MCRPEAARVIIVTKLRHFVQATKLIAKKNNSHPQMKVTVAII
jgi:hypothetical protein